VQALINPPFWSQMNLQIQHGGQNMVMEFTVQTLTLWQAKRVRKYANVQWVTEYGLHQEIL